MLWYSWIWLQIQIACESPKHFVRSNHTIAVIDIVPNYIPKCQTTTIIISVIIITITMELVVSVMRAIAPPVCIKVDHALPVSPDRVAWMAIALLIIIT